MAVRSSMANLITAVRLLVDDPNPNPGVTVVQFTDQQYQDALDHSRSDYRYLELAPAPTIASGGQTTWKDYYFDVGSETVQDWEDDWQIVGPTFAVLTPLSVEVIVGHVVFSADTRPPIYMVAKAYDRYAAAVEILQNWAAQMSRNYDFRSDGQHFAYSQQRAGLLEMAATYRAQCKPRMLQSVRHDVPEELWTRRNFDIDRTSF